MEDFYQSIIIRNPISSFHLISAFSSATGLRQHLKRHTTCKLAVAKMPGTFSLYNLPKMEKHIQSPPIPTESSLYNIQGNTSIKDPHLQYYKVQQTSAVDDNFNPGKGDTGIIAHIDDSGTETALFLDQQSRSLSTKYLNPRTSSLVVHHPSIIPSQMDQYVADVDSNMLIQSKLVSSLDQTNPPNPEQNVSSNNEISNNVTNTFLVDVRNTSEDSEQLSMPSNLDTFPFTLAVEQPNDSQ